MSIPLKSFLLRNSLVLYQASVKIKNVHPFGSSSMYSTAAAQVESSTSAEYMMAKPLSEMPGLNTMSALKIFLKKKIIKDEKSLDVYDSKNVFKFWREMRDIYGPTFKVTLAAQPKFVVITDPDHVETLYKMTMNDPVRTGLYSLKKIRDEAVNNFFDKKSGILTENHEEWKRVRSKVQAPMMRPKNIIKYLKEMDNVSIDFTDRIAELQRKHGEMPRDFQHHIYKWALESVSTVALNRRLGCLNPNLPSDSEQMKLINSVNSLFELLNITEMEFPWWKFIPSPSYKKLKEKHEFVTSIVHSHIIRAEKEMEKKLSNKNVSAEDLSLLEILLQTEGLTRKDVVTFMLDMFVAGIDTTSHTLAFSLYLLSRNQEKQKKLQEEVDIVLGDGKESMTEANLAKLSYLKACVKETLRLFPLGIGNVRMLEEDAVLAGYKIPKGYLVMALNLVTASDEKNFKQSKDFIPERWMRDKPLGPIHPYAALPFSHGTRMCIGRRIAEQEMYTFLARIMHRFNVDYKYEDIDVVSRMVAVPSKPLRFEFTERK